MPEVLVWGEPLELHGCLCARRVPQPPDHEMIKAIPYNIAACLAEKIYAETCIAAPGCKKDPAWTKSPQTPSPLDAPLEELRALNGGPTLPDKVYKTFWTQFKK